MNVAWLDISPLFTPRTCPFLIICIASYPCNVLHAVSKEKGSGSLEQDGSIAIVAMEEKKQTRLMHHYRLGKRERHADKTSETLA